MATNWHTWFPSDARQPHGETFGDTPHSGWMQLGDTCFQVRCANFETKPLAAQTAWQITLEMKLSERDGPEGDPHVFRVICANLNGKYAAARTQ